MDQRTLNQEKRHYQDIRKRLENDIQSMSEEQEHILNAVKAQNRQMTEEMGTAPAYGDFDAYVGFAQALAMEKQLLEQRGHHALRLQKYQHMINKIYFSRLDYQETGEDTHHPLYIGYGNYMNDQTMDIYVYDWRSPIASIYYDYNLGPVAYQAPDGTITGHVALKRQYDIVNGDLHSYCDTQFSMVDEKLIQTLSAPSSGKMSEIAETIGAEQNHIIRETDAKAVFVQGIAGSGKTIVALHRIAYLMYHGLKKRLHANEVLVLSPHALFSEYIEDVLPDLGEAKVLPLTLIETIEKAIGRTYTHEPHYLALERDIIDTSNAMRQVETAIKGDARFLKHIEQSLSSYTQKHGFYKDFYYHDQLLISAKDMQSFIEDTDYQRPLLKKLARFSERVNKVADEARKRYYSQRLQYYTKQPQYAYEAKALARIDCIRESKRLKDTLNETTKLPLMSAYRKLFQHPKTLKNLFPEYSYELISNMCAQTKWAIKHHKLTRQDMVLIAHLYLCMTGEHNFTGIKHVVVDESQDYDVMAFMLLEKLFPDAHYTVLGDHHQTVQSNYAKNHHTLISDAMKHKQSLHLNLTIGYRNQQAIGSFCNALLGIDSKGQMIARPGDKPKAFVGQNSLNQAIDHLIEKGYTTFALITKSMLHSKTILANNKTRHSIKLINPEEASLPKGIVTLPVYFAKGLEFDAVIVVDADEHHYCDSRDQRLAYVASSRALHALCLQSNSSIAPMFQKGLLQI